MQVVVLDVLIIGVGLLGIGVVYYFKIKNFGKMFEILEVWQVMGGIWDFFCYFGVCLDLDVFMLGYSFKFWLGCKFIVDGGDICQYIQDVVDEGGIIFYICFGYRVKSVEWLLEESFWIVIVEQEDGMFVF